MTFSGFVITMGWIVPILILILLTIAGFNFVQKGIDIASNDSNRLNATKSAVGDALDKAKEDITLPVWLVILLLIGIYLIR